MRAGLKIHPTNSSFINFGGTNINFRSGERSSAVAVSGDFFSYFDDVSSGLPGGLGVCRALDGAAGTTAPGAECADSGDDSIDGEGGIREAIQLRFQTSFDLRSISFRDGAHNSINDSMGLVEYAFVSGGGLIGSGETTFANLVALVAAGTFAGTTAIQLGYVNTDFYIESISDVPIPGAIPLLLSGLGGSWFRITQKEKSVSKPKF